MLDSTRSSRLMAEFGAIVGPAKMRSPSASEAGAATLIVEPSDPDEIAAVVRKCEADKITMVAMGAARTLGVIRTSPVALGLSLARMNRIIAYEPDDMTVVAEAGLTLAELNAVLARHGQRLPADPRMPQLTTLGALVAAAQAGPLRHSEGTMRDALIGIRFVGHDGRLVHGGGQVVKNVAGYDLMKVMTGSFGTLGIITEVAFKLRPIPQRYTLVTAQFEDGADGFAMAEGIAGELPLLHLDATSAGVSHRLGLGAGFTLFAGFGGSAAEVDFMRARIIELLGARSEIHAPGESRALYEDLRDFTWPQAAISAQLAVPPAALAQSLQRCEAEFRAHAGIGVAQLYTADASLTGSPKAAPRALEQTQKWRGIAHAARGHLRILAVSPASPPGLAIFDEPEAVALGLMRRLKTAFDPHGIFNPSCFVDGL
ncbi:MAG: FAD-binding oxidoreductase [Candidatus Binataceae bacterium]